MSELNLRSTLRDLRAHLLRPQVATVIAGVALVIGLSGPNDTWATQSLPVRLLFWTCVVWLTYSAGFIVTVHLTPHVQPALLVLRIVAVALAVAIAVFMALFALNLAFGQSSEDLGSAVRSFGAVFVICLAIETSGQALGARHEPKPAAATFDEILAILLRLPLQKRGQLLSLSAQDQYVDVATPKGHEMMLLRLGDAIRETAPVSGLQVHRSHWVALAAVASAAKRGDGAVLTLTSGQTVPVSRGFMTALREAALLPGKAS